MSRPASSADVKRLRDRLAVHYFRNTAYSIRVIAFPLGFEDSNSFYREFLGWTEMTSKQARSRGGSSAQN